MTINFKENKPYGAFEPCDTQEQADEKARQLFGPNIVVERKDGYTTEYKDPITGEVRGTSG
jgi:hypothetical protein